VSLAGSPPYFAEMARYVVERTFQHGLDFAGGVVGSEQCLEIVERNTDEGVTWLHSYVSDDGRRMFCVYDAPNPEVIRKTAKHIGFPVDRITQVRVLDPYFYGGSAA
jgi:hypothetical protein